MEMPSVNFQMLNKYGVPWVVDEGKMFIFQRNGERGYEELL